MRVVPIGAAVIRLRNLGPAEAAEAENEKDREYRENEDRGESVDGLDKLKHEGLPDALLQSVAHFN